MIDEQIMPLKCYSKNVYGLDKLLDHARDRSVLLFGESCHGVADFHLLMADIIPWLHSIGEAEVVAFEAGVGECFNVYHQAEEMEAEEMVKSSMYLSSKCQELVPLFQYIKDVRNSTTPLYSIGIDPRPLQRSQNWLADLVHQQDYNHADVLSETERMVKSWSLRGFIQDDVHRAQYEDYHTICTTNYDGLLDFVTCRISEGAEDDEENIQLAVAKRVVENRLGILDVLCDETAYYEYREKALADNLQWIMNDLFPGKRVVVWGHGGHTRKMGSRTDCMASMCEIFLTGRSTDLVYSVGMFPHCGRGAWNNREEYEMATPPETSMEDRLCVDDGAVFVDLCEIAQQGETWVQEPCITLSWGTEHEELVPVDQFDGVLIVSAVRPPTYLP
jgi:erythromycin esterase